VFSRQGNTRCMQQIQPHCAWGSCKRLLRDSRATRVRFCKSGLSTTGCAAARLRLNTKLASLGRAHAVRRESRSDIRRNATWEAPHPRVHPQCRSRQSAIWVVVEGTDPACTEASLGSGPPNLESTTSHRQPCRIAEHPTLQRQFASNQRVQSLFQRWLREWSCPASPHAPIRSKASLERAHLPDAIAAYFGARRRHRNQGRSEFRGASDTESFADS